MEPIKNLPSGDFFILFNTKTLQLFQKLSAILVWKPENCLYICNRLAQIMQGKHGSGEILKRPTRADCKSAV